MRAIVATLLGLLSMFNSSQTVAQEIPEVLPQVEFRFWITSGTSALQSRSPLTVGFISKSNERTYGRFQTINPDDVSTFFTMQEMEFSSNGELLSTHRQKLLNEVVEIPTDFDGIEAMVREQLSDDSLRRVSREDGAKLIFLESGIEAKKSLSQRMSGFVFLGQTNIGDINSMDLRKCLSILSVTDDLRRFKYERDREQGEFQFRQVAPSQWIVEKYTIKISNPQLPSEETKEPNPFANTPHPDETQVIGSIDEWNGETASQTMKTVVTYRSSEPATTVRKARITGIQTKTLTPFQFYFPPKEGERVILKSDQQIAAEWRSGRVVRTFDQGVVNDLYKSQFLSPSEPTRWKFFGLVGMLFVVPIASYVLWRFLGR